MAAIVKICRAISSMALWPSRCRLPECAGTPVAAASKRPIAFAAARRGFERADRMHGIDVRKDEDAGAVAIGSRHKGVAESGSAGLALDPDRDPGEIRRDAIDHAIDRRNLPGRALDLDPAPDTFDRRTDIDPIVARIWHVDSADVCASSARAPADI